MWEDRQWMYNRLLPGRKSFVPGFFEGVQTFIQFACSQNEFKVEGRLRCPCFRCRNCKYDVVENVTEHIYRYGFMGDYYQWTSHGEPYLLPTTVASTSNDQAIELSVERDNQFEGDNWCREMVMDVAGPSFMGNEAMTTEEEPNVQAKRFYDLLRDAEEPLYNGCGNHS